MNHLLVSQENGVLLVTINRPDALNSINMAMLQELDEVFSNIDKDTCRVVVIHGGEGKAFIAGADVGEMKDFDVQQATEFGRYGNEVFLKIENCPVPVIAAINGYCLGGGNELAMSCDIRIASEKALFGQPEVKLGITPGFGGTQRLARVIGSMSAVMQVLFAAENFGANEALRLGLISQVYPKEQVLEEAMKLANTIASHAPIAVRNCKRAAYEGLSLPIEEAIEVEVKYFSECFRSEDQKMAMTAFVDRTKVDKFHNK